MIAGLRPVYASPKISRYQGSSYSYRLIKRFKPNKISWHCHNHEMHVNKDAHCSWSFRNVPNLFAFTYIPLTSLFIFAPPCNVFEILKTKLCSCHLQQIFVQPSLFKRVIGTLSQLCKFCLKGVVSALLRCAIA